MKKNNQPICKIIPNGDKYWYLNGKRHREDGPAIEDIDGDKYWYINGKLHRVDGPAVEFANGEKRWYYQGIDFTEKYNCNSQKAFNRLLKLKI
jgi:hypothetical protein